MIKKERKGGDPYNKLFNFVTITSNKEFLFLGKLMKRICFTRIIPQEVSRFMKNHWSFFLPRISLQKPKGRQELYAKVGRGVLIFEQVGERLRMSRRTILILPDFKRKNWISRDTAPHRGCKTECIFFFFDQIRGNNSHAETRVSSSRWGQWKREWFQCWD